MEAHELADLLARRAAGEVPYLEFIRVPDLSVGLYVLPAGGVDRQQPHAEDEVYHVLAGQARITVGDETREVRPGATLYVAARVPHRFHDIATDLRLLVFFAPAESPPTA
jgi:mannose-6-phosphate isomerase-like protein (cupin superfamily)